jgi:hypothetical protein
LRIDSRCVPCMESCLVESCDLLPCKDLVSVDGSLIYTWLRGVYDSGVIKCHLLLWLLEGKA